MLSTNIQQQTKKKIYKKQKQNKLYNIENILDIKTIEGQKLYLVKWEGYREEENTWEPYKNLATAKQYILELENKMNAERNLNLKIKNKNEQMEEKKNIKKNKKAAAAVVKESSSDDKVESEASKSNKNKVKLSNNKNKIVADDDLVSNNNDNNNNNNNHKKKNNIKNIQNNNINNPIVICSSENDNSEGNNEELTLLGKKRRFTDGNNTNNKTQVKLVYKRSKGKKVFKDLLEEKLENIVNANLRNDFIDNNNKTKTRFALNNNKLPKSDLKIKTDNNFTLNSPVKSEFIEEVNPAFKSKRETKRNKNNITSCKEINLIIPSPQIHNNLEHPKNITKDPTQGEVTIEKNTLPSTKFKKSNSGQEINLVSKDDSSQIESSRNKRKTKRTNNNESKQTKENSALSSNSKSCEKNNNNIDFNPQENQKALIDPSSTNFPKTISKSKLKQKEISEAKTLKGNSALELQKPQKEPKTVEVETRIISESTLEHEINFEDVLKKSSISQHLNSNSNPNLAFKNFRKRNKKNNSFQNNNNDNKNKNNLELNAPLGSFEKGDVPARIFEGHVTNDYLIFLKVEWKKRADGVLPQPCLYCTRILRDKCPDLIIDYYENKIIERQKRK